MKRFGPAVAAIAIALFASTAPASAAGYEADRATKIHVMGEWAHPDDDVSFIGPCGVWHQRYKVRCGIIMVTRGEGGGNAAGTELGPQLGLRRENEDRVAHYRSGTIDVFNLDRVDFFYNLSAPLTQLFWKQDETLRRITRIIRMTQPDVYVGFTPSLRAGHGNHQQAGRYIWEGMKAAADPTTFPEQLRGPHALRTWRVKKVFSGGSTAGTGGSASSPHCTTGFVPAASNRDAVVGTWLGYASPSTWAEGNVQGQPAGTRKSWAQVAAEGTRAYPTQSRTMYQETAAPSCSRLGQTYAEVPFQPNLTAAGKPNPKAGRDDAILYGAVVEDPGGLPLGTRLKLAASRFESAPGAPFTVTVKLRSPRRLRDARATLDVPDGWQVDGATKPLRRGTARFTVTPSASATPSANHRIAARVRAGRASGYADTVVRVVAPVEGRVERWGTTLEYDRWLTGTAPLAQRIGFSTAAQSIALGGRRAIAVEVRNRSQRSQTGEVRLTLPAGIEADAAAKPYGTLAAGASTKVRFTLRSSGTTLPANPVVELPVATTFAGGSASEALTLNVVPRTTIPKAASAPTVDGRAAAGEYAGPALDVGRKWEGSKDCAPAGVDCGSTGEPGGPTSSYARLTWADDALYAFIHVRDSYQGYAVTPAECVAHWLADSVELMIDPRGNASETSLDTASTFKLGIFPYTNDPSNRNGNGANGPCWSRDADNHQGYSTGPLADTVADAPNAPGVQVASSARWVGSNETTVDHAYAGGGYDLEVKLPLAVLPAAVDPDDVALNITPYDNDDNSAPGTTALRHIDANQTRLAWSAIGGVQATPYRWGRASLEGYAPPPGRPTTPAPPNASSPNLDGTLSPQTIAQSARDGVPIAGRTPVSARNRIRVPSARLTDRGAELTIASSGPGTARVFLWSGPKGFVPVFRSSCPPPGPGSTPEQIASYGLDACARTDGGFAPWGTNMGGRVLGSNVVAVRRGVQRVRIPLDAAARARLARDGSALVSYRTAADAVQALDVPLRRR